MNDTDFRQFTGAFDTAVEPDSAFAEQLRKRLAAEEPAKHVAVQPVVIALPLGRAAESGPSGRRHPLYIAAAVLVVFALGFASVIQLAPSLLEPQYASQAMATLPADPGSMPGTDINVATEKLPGIENVGQTHLIGNNLIAVVIAPESDRHDLVSYDMESGDVQWQAGVPGWSHFVFGDEVVVGISYLEPAVSEPDTLPTLDQMTAYDIHTGAKVWSISLADWEMMYGWETIEMVGDTVVLVLGGELVAIDSLTGETRWQTDYHLAQTEEENYVQPPDLLQVNGELYLGQVDGSVEVLDLATGALVRQFALPPSLGAAHPVSLQMFSVPAGLLVAADTYVGSGSLTTLVVVNPADGSAVWERALDHSGRINVAPDGSIAVATYAWNSAPLVLRLLGRDGYSTSALVWLDANGETILETEPVRLTDMSPLVIASSPTYACITVQEFTCFDRAGTRYLPDADNVWDARFEGDVQILFTDAGVMRVVLP